MTPQLQALVDAVKTVDNAMADYLATQTPAPSFDKAFLTPFCNNSPWNVQPKAPVLGPKAIVVSGSKNWPMFAGAAWGDHVFYARATDPPATVTAWVGDELRKRDVVFPHWPVDAVPATGTDHHMDVYDETTKLLHSFWGLVKTAGTTDKWTAAKYCVFDPVNGTGFGSPKRPDGPRAAGCPAAAGLLRIAEQDSPVIGHALAFGIDQAMVATGPTFPATQQDYGAYATFVGSIHTGTRMMLAPDFDDTGMPPQAKAIVAALKTFGGLVVDTTGVGGGWDFYDEIGGTWASASGWTAANGRNVNLDKIVAALQPMLSCAGWLDRAGAEVTPQSWDQMPMLSMRGPWNMIGGAALVAGSGAYDTISDLYELPDSTGKAAFSIQKTIYFNNPAAVEWFKTWTSSCWYINPVPGKTYNFSASGYGTAGVSIAVFDASWKKLAATSGMAPGAVQSLVWPAGGTIAQVYVSKPVGPAAAIRLDMTLA